MTLLHVPYTLWHLSYVAIGVALAPQWRPGVLGLALAAFFLGMGVAAHALDEFQGRPLGTGISNTTLICLAGAGLVGAAAIGVGVALHTSLWLLAFVLAGVFIAVAYNLELFGGLLHGDLWFAVAWGALPVVASYFAAAATIRIETLLAASFAGLLSLAQRWLSTPVRLLRRRARTVQGRMELTDGTSLAVTTESLTHPCEQALRALSACVVALALALVVVRIT